MSVVNFIEENNIRGFLADDEGCALHALALSVSGYGPCLEVGSYCGKSTIHIGSACREVGNTLYALDHHRGSEEHQLGEEYHDPELYDKSSECMDSFPQFRKAVSLAELDDTVVPIVSSSSVVLKHWMTPLGMVFIDGGHSPEVALADVMGWSQHIVSGGYMAIHDIFEDPNDGGQGPFIAMMSLFDKGKFEILDKVNSLGILRKR